MKNHKKIGLLCRIQFLMLLFSLSTVLSKVIGQETGITLRALLLYALLLAILGGYAFLWQKVIKIVPLSFAYANKGVTVIWGLIWGSTIFEETISAWKILGCVLIIGGVILFACSNDTDKEGE